MQPDRVEIKTNRDMLLALVAAEAALEQANLMLATIRTTLAECSGYE